MKRVFSLLLVMMMFFTTALPMTAFAAEAEGEQILSYGDSGTVETQIADEPAIETEEVTVPPVESQEISVTPDELETPIDTLEAATASNTASAEPSKLIAPPDFMPQNYRPMRLMAAAQAERNPNPNIVYTYSPAILNGVGPIIFTDSITGMPAYCLDYNRGVPSPDSLDGENDFDPETVFDPATYEGLKCLLLAGYPYKKGNGLTDAEAQGCTQFAIWCWTYETMGYGMNAANYTAIPGKEYIYDYFISMMEAARNQTWPELALSAADVHMIKDGDMLTGQTTVHFDNLQGGYSLDESKLPEGMTVTGYTGNDGDVLTFTAPLSFAGHSLVLEGILSGHDERSDLNIFWYDNKNPNQQCMAISVMDTTTIAIEADIAMQFEGVGVIKLLKQSAVDELPLAYAVFGVFNAETDEKITEITTDENGEATVTLPYGDFYLQELSAPAGFRLSDQQYPVHLDQAEIIVTAVNEKTGGFLKLLKTDENGGKLANAVFGVYDAATDEKICELTTDEHGEAAATLPVGSFYLLELVAPVGFQKSDERISFIVTDNETVEMTVTNTPIPPEPEQPKNGYLQIIKIEQGKNIFLGGAVFGVYNADTDEKICELTTGTDGKASVELPEGRFYVKELIAPAGFQLVADKTSFTIKPTETVVLTVENPRIPETPKTGFAKIIKRAEETNEKLAGAVFGIYRASDNEKVAELTSGADGTVTSAALAVGDYYLLELKAPANFLLKSDKVNFTVKENQTTEITFTNKAVPPDEPSPGKIVIIKKSEDTGKKLSGAVFGVYSASTDQLIGKLTTATDGKAGMELEAGKYYLRELTPPSGFQPEDKKISFTIKEGETKEITITNKPVEPEPGELTLIKKAEGSNKLLKNAEFAVYDSATDKKVATLKTDNYGEATVELPEGDFYLIEQKSPEGFELSKDKIIFSIKSGEQKTITVTNKPVKAEPTTGTLLLVKSAETTGKRLENAVFGVYDASNDKKITEIKTGADGTVTLELEPSNYYLRELKSPAGYKLDSTKIPFTVSKAGVTVKVEVTNELETVVIPNENPPMGGITVPKTGETPPYGNYILALLCMGIAGLCGVLLYRGRKVKMIG